MDARVETENSAVTIDSQRWSVPGTIRDTAELEQRLVVSITPPERIIGDFDHLAEDADFTLPSTNRNLVAFTASGERDWIVKEPPQSEADDGFVDIYLLAGRLIVTNKDDHHYQIDPRAGDILDSWSESSLPIGDRVVSFNGAVRRIHQVDDLVVETGTTPTSFYGYETDGSLRWQRHGNAGLEIRDGALAETIVPNDSRRAIVRLDPDTGKRVEVLESDLPDPEQYVSASER